MKISIVIPSYNYAQFLTECLNSIINQSYDDFEVLISDGGSTDGSVAIGEEFCAKDSRFRMVSYKDNGQANAINIGLRNATGSIQCYLNADDTFVCSNCLRWVIDAFSSYPGCRAVGFGGFFIGQNGRVIKEINYRYHPFDHRYNYKRRTAFLQPGLFWRRDCWERHGFNEKWHYAFDALFFYKIISSEFVLFDNRPVCGYRLHGENKSLTIRPRRIAELCCLESFKYHPWHYRVLFLRIVSVSMAIFDAIPIVGQPLCQGIRMSVNTFAFLTCYRFPSV